VPTIQFKSSNFDRKPSWKNAELNSLGDALHDSIDPVKFQIGDQAIYIHSRVYLDDGKAFLYWVCLDIESKENHSSISANIKAAQDLLLLLDDHGLTEGLVILLSGSGFRFVWPWVVPLEWKGAFSSWIQTVACIDWGLNLGNKFIRMAGYRGNANQGKPTKDVHIEALPDIHDIWFLTEVDYQFMVEGKPPEPEDMTWLPSVLPGPIYLPANWQTFLQDFKTRAELAASLWTPEDLPEPSTIDRVAMWQQAHAFLDDSGITYHERQINDYTITKLNTCPSCGKKTGGPYITEAGILKDHRATCDAGQRDTEGRIIGLKPHEWIPGYTAVHTDGDDCQGDEDQGFNTVGEIRAHYAVKAQDTERDQIYIGSPGTGKSYGITKAWAERCTVKNILEQGTSPKVIYAAPTHKLAKEIVKQVKEFQGDDIINVNHIKGRNKDNCRQYLEISKVQKSGYFMAGVMFCYECTEEHGVCEYKEQFKCLDTPGFTVTCHAQICSINLDELKINTLIFDEDPLSSCIKNDTVTHEDIMKFSAGYMGNGFEKISKCLHRIYQAANDDQRTFGAQARRYTGEAPKGSKWAEDPVTGATVPKLFDDAGIDDQEKNRMLRHLDGMCGQREIESKNKWLWRLYEDDVNFTALNWLWTSLGENHGFSYVKINLNSKIETSMFQFVRVYKDIPKFKGQIVVLDGTGSKAEVDSLFNRDFEDVPGRLKIACEKTLVKIGMGKVKAKRILGDNPVYLKSIARAAITHLRPKDQKVLIATHMFMEGHMLEVFQELLPERTFETIHFYGNRGINTFKDFDSIICFGGPGTNQAVRLDEAMILFPDNKDRLKWFDQKATAELIQTVQRVRLSFGDKNLILVHRKWIPELGRLNGLIDARKGSDKTVHSIEKAYQRAKKFYKVYGFCTIEALIALGIGLVSQKKLIEKVTVLSYRHLYRYIIIGDDTSKTRPSKPELLLFQRKNFASDLIARLEAEFVGQRYEKKVHAWKSSQWTRAYGSINAAKIFYRVFGKPFNPEDWRKKYNEDE